MKKLWVTPDEVTREHIQRVLAWDVDGLLLRCRGLSGRSYLQLAKRAREETWNLGKELWVHTWEEVAQRVGADKLHLPERFLKEACLLTDLPLSVSVHSAEAARNAVQKGAHSLLFGPIFPTESKRAYGPPQGLEKLAALQAQISLPIYVVGGLSPSHFQVCPARGVAGIMMQGYLCEKLKKERA